MTNFWHRYFGGHFTLGPLTVYGANAMDWAVNVKSRWGYICFTLPTLRRFVKVAGTFIYPLMVLLGLPLSILVLIEMKGSCQG